MSDLDKRRNVQTSFLIRAALPHFGCNVALNRHIHFKRPEIDLFQASEPDSENVYEPDQLLDSDEERDKSEDVEISILYRGKNHLSDTFGFCLNKRRPPSNKRRIKKVEF